jgi:hypothetical protein
MDLDDPSRAATLLIEEHGENAAVTFAILRVIRMQTTGDEQGRGIWLRVLSALLDLRTTRPRGGQAIH